MTTSRTFRQQAARGGVALALALASGAWPWPVGAATLPAASAASSSPHRATSRPAVPAANFFVEWRIQQAAAGVGQAQVFTSRSAATGGSGFGPGAVVVGTAQGAGGEASQGLRVANGQEGRLELDRPRTRTVYDLTWTTGRADQDTSQGMSGQGSIHPGGAASHEEAVHHVQGLRVVPRWTHGDTLPLELSIVRDASSTDDPAVSLRTTVQVSLGEWTGVARLGAGDDELQVRVSWR
jgi:hypothetical protein